MSNTTDSEEGRTSLDANEVDTYSEIILVVVLCLVLICLVITVIKITCLIRSRRQHQPITSDRGEGTVQEARNTAVGVKPNDDRSNSHWKFNTGAQVEAGHLSSETNTGYQNGTSYGTQVYNKDNHGFSHCDELGNSGTGRDYSRNRHECNRSGYYLNMGNVVDEPIYNDVKHEVDDTHYDFPPGAIKPVQPAYDYLQPRPAPVEPLYDRPVTNPVPIGRAAAAVQDIYDYPRQYENFDYIYDYPPPNTTPVQTEVPDESLYDHPPNTTPVQTEVPDESHYDHPPNTTPVQTEVPDESLYDHPPNTTVQTEVPDESLYDHPPNLPVPVAPRRGR